MIDYWVVQLQTEFISTVDLPTLPEKYALDFNDGIFLMQTLLRKISALKATMCMSNITKQHVNQTEGAREKVSSGLDSMCVHWL